MRVIVHRIRTRAWCREREKVYIDTSEPNNWKGLWCFKVVFTSLTVHSESFWCLSHRCEPFLHILATMVDGWYNK